MSQKSAPEEEWFARVEAERRRRLAERMADADSARKAAELRDLHLHRCGKCGQPMLTQAFKGVEIEICPSCGAVLLDAGELDALTGGDRQNVIDTITTVFGFRKKWGGG
jgi:ribosomal protein S27AE